MRTVGSVREEKYIETAAAGADGHLGYFFPSNSYSLQLQVQLLDGRDPFYSLERTVGEWMRGRRGLSEKAEAEAEAVAMERVGWRGNSRRSRARGRQCRLEGWPSGAASCLHDLHTLTHSRTHALDRLN